MFLVLRYRNTFKADINYIPTRQMHLLSFLFPEDAQRKIAKTHEESIKTLANLSTFFALLSDMFYFPKTHEESIKP